MSKTAVVLFNLGGPDSLEAVQPFLFNLFSDPLIFRIPNPLRHILAKIISRKRAEKTRLIYEKIGGKSPLLEHTQAQADRLQEKPAQQGNYRCFVAMRHWRPMTGRTVKQVEEYQPEKIILLPLYPQFSSTTTLSSLRGWKKRTRHSTLKNIPAHAVCCYPAHPLFVASYAASILRVYGGAAQKGTPRILFSAHGLPEKIVKSGDPYQWQVEQSVAEIMSVIEGQKSEAATPQGAAEGNISSQNYDYRICYQSRVGPLKWIGPSTEQEIKRAGADGVPIILVPVSFVSEHSETLVELDIEYKNLAAQHGCEQYFRVPAPGTDEWFISALADICAGADFSSPVCSHAGRRICPKQFGDCPVKY